MRTRYDDKVQELRRAVLDGPGELDREARHAAFSGAAVPPEAAAYVEKLRRHAYKVTDRDVEALLAAGWSEDQVFELTVATALGEGGKRLDAALRAMEAE